MLEEEPFNHYRKGASTEASSAIHARWKTKHITQNPRSMIAGGRYGIRKLVPPPSSETLDTPLDTETIADIALTDGTLSLSLSQPSVGNLVLRVTIRRNGKPPQYETFRMFKVCSKYKVETEGKTLCTLEVIEVKLGENPKIYLRVDFPPDDNLEA